MNLKQLECICAVHRLGSLSAAARDLGITQQALSKSLKSLENELGIELFFRTSSGMIDNPDALLLIENASSILEDVEGLRQTARKIKNPHPGTISIGIVNGLIGGTYAPIKIDEFAEFSSHYPDVYFEMHELSPHEIGHQTHMGLLDIGIVNDTASPRCASEKIFQAPLKAVVSTRSPLADKDGIGWFDLRDSRILNTYEGTWLHTGIVDKCIEARFLPKFVPALKEFSGNVELVRAGEAVFLCADTHRVLELNYDDVRIIDFARDERLDFFIQFVWNRRVTLSRECLALKDFFAEKLNAIH